MWWNPVVWAAWVLERWWMWRELRRPETSDPRLKAGECDAGLNIRGKMMSDISEFRIIGRDEHGSGGRK